jgi:hypothetical protein
MKKTLISFAFVMLVVFSAASQTTFEMPENVQLKSDADYAKYETDIINAAKWLEETDLDKETKKRAAVNAFVMNWLTGAPNVTVDITQPILKLYQGNTELLAIYLGGYSREFLANKNSATKRTATKAGLISMIKVYKKGISLNKNKEMEKLVKMYDENKLDEYIQSTFE